MNVTVFDFKVPESDIIYGDNALSATYRHLSEGDLVKIEYDSGVATLRIKEVSLFTPCWVGTGTRRVAIGVEMWPGNPPRKGILRKL